MVALALHEPELDDLEVVVCSPGLGLVLEGGVDLDVLPCDLDVHVGRVVAVLEEGGLERL